MTSMNFLESVGIQRASGRMMALVCILLTSGILARGQDVKPSLIKMSIDDLMSMEITSVSKKPQKLSDTAAAAFVITQDDIRRSGATTLPEVLRMAPGVEVARIDGNKWSVTVRGFSGRFANKLLVLVDGRSVYTPLFSGVFWNTLDVMLENIDRIEVVRGPGAAVWGPNAVNGVINIITKRAEETTGTLVTAGGGIHAPASGVVRHGGSLGNHGFYRAYAKYYDQSSTRTIAGTDAADRSSDTRGGFRTDWNLGSANDLVVMGELSRENSGEWSRVPKTVIPPFFALSDARTNNSETSLSGQWTRKLSDSSDFMVQSYYDRTSLVGPLAIDRLTTGGLDFQHRIEVLSSNELLWGMNYRFYDDNTSPTSTSSFVPPVRNTHLLSSFVQDEIELMRDRLRLTAGSKFHDDSYSGFGIQPSIRLLWTPAARQSVWMAVSRALRTPSRYESDLRQFYSVSPDPTGNPNAPGVATTFSGSPAFRSETLRAHEIGYRVRPSNRLSLDVAGFYNVYGRLRTFESGQPFISAQDIPHLVVPYSSGNAMKGETYGAEFSADARLRQNWRLTGNYSFLSMQLHLKSSTDNVSTSDEGASPKHQAYVRSSFDLTKNIETDVTWRMVGQLLGLQVARYSVADVRLSFRANPFTEFSLSAQNLGTEKGHTEFAPTYTDAMPLAVVVRPSVFIKATFKF